MARGSMVALVGVGLGAVALLALSHHPSAGPWKLDTAVLGPGQAEFLDRMRAAVPAYIPMTVTSGYRSPADQAAALRHKMAIGQTTDDLLDLYNHSAAIRELVIYPQDQWTQVLTDQVNRGVYLSRHMRGDGLDFRVHDANGNPFPQSWVAAMIEGAKKAGATNTVWEDKNDPRNRHLHVEGGMRPPSGSSVSGARGYRRGERLGSVSNEHQEATMASDLVLRSGAGGGLGYLVGTMFGGPLLGAALGAVLGAGTSLAEEPAPAAKSSKSKPVEVNLKRRAAGLPRGAF